MNKYLLRILRNLIRIKPTGLFFVEGRQKMRKATESSASRHFRHAENLVAVSPDAIITTDSSYRIVQFNEAAGRIFHYSPEEVLGQPLNVLLPERFRKNHAQYVTNFGKQGVSYRKKGLEVTLTGLRADQTEFPMEGSICYYEYSDEMFYSIFLRDVTMRKQAEAQDKKLNLLLTDQLNKLQQFGYIASHHLRGPVSTMKGLLQLADMKGDQLTDEEMGNYFRQTVGQLDATLNDLHAVLDPSQIKSSDYEWVDLQSLMKESCEKLSKMISVTEAEISTDFNTLTRLFGIRAGFAQVFYQLLSNALKYCDGAKQPVISIRSYRQQGICYLEFKDQGLGIDMDKYGDKVFSLYSRFHRQPEGKGIGLWMVHNLVDQMGGKINVQSKVNQGTTFTIQFADQTV